MARIAGASRRATDLAFRKCARDGRDRRFFGYMARGVPYGPDDGTIAPWAMLASLPFAPSAALAGTRRLLECVSASLPPGPIFKRLQSDAAGRDRRLAFRGMVRARSGPARDDDRKLSHRPGLGDHASIAATCAMGSNVPVFEAGGSSDAKRLRSRAQPDDRGNLPAACAAGGLEESRTAKLPTISRSSEPGPAGLAAAESAARLGFSVALIERNRMGGNSLNVGSVPSKAIIRTATSMA